IAHRRARAFGIDVHRTPMGDHVVAMDGAEIDAEPGTAGIVRHRRVKLRPGEEDDPSYRRKQPDLRIELDRLFGPGLLAGVRLDVLRGFHAARAVPLVVVVFPRSVPDRAVPVPGMER